MLLLLSAQVDGSFVLLDAAAATGGIHHVLETNLDQSNKKPRSVVINFYIGASLKREKRIASTFYLWLNQSERGVQHLLSSPPRSKNEATQL